MTLGKAAGNLSKTLQENALEPSLLHQIKPVETLNLVPSVLRQEGAHVSPRWLCWVDRMPLRAAFTRVLTENKRAPSSLTAAVTAKDKCSTEVYRINQRVMARRLH